MPSSVEEVPPAIYRMGTQGYSMAALVLPPGPGRRCTYPAVHTPTAVLPGTARMRPALPAVLPADQRRLGDFRRNITR